MKRIVLIFAVLAFALAASAQKKVSILGDSYSTFKDHIPSINACWYPDACNDVKEVEQTWWHQFINKNGYQLEKNNSWSGSTVCNTGYDAKDYSDRSFFTRVNMLGNPDIILIFGGTNDSWCGAKVGEYKYKNWTKPELYTYRPALSYLLASAKMLYPEAEIYFILNTELRDDINESTMTVCKKHKIPVIVLKDIAKQGGHPCIEGMTAISDQITDFINSQK